MGDREVLSRRSEASDPSVYACYKRAGKLIRLSEHRFENCDQVIGWLNGEGFMSEGSKDRKWGAPYYAAVAGACQSPSSPLTCADKWLIATKACLRLVLR